jgi:TldD protein
MTMDIDLADRALERALKLSADYVEFRSQATLYEQVIMRNGVLEAYVKGTDDGFGIRVLADGGVGFASSDKWNSKEVDSVVESACKLAKSSSRKNRLNFPKSKGSEVKWVVEEKRSIQNVSTEEKINELKTLDKDLTSLGVNVSSRILQCTVNIAEKYYANSEGAKIFSRLPSVACFGVISVSEQGRVEQAIRQFGYSGGWEAFDEWDLRGDLGHETSVLQRMMREGSTVSPGKTTVVCGSEVIGIACHESCGHPMEADRILGREMSQAGMSFIFQGGPYWLGSKIGSEHVTIVDDPTLENSYGFYKYDDEGVEARRRYLYKEGVINEFLQNRETAVRMGVNTNGSSRAENYDKEPIVRMANTFLLPGDFSDEELLEDIKEGIYMKSFTEWNIDDRRFNERYVGREAYKIVNGELGLPVARPTLEITTGDFWSSIDAVGKKVEFDAATCGKGDPMQGVPVFTGGPSARLREVYLK